MEANEFEMAALNGIRLPFASRRVTWTHIVSASLLE
jgi:hypothetical protein